MPPVLRSAECDPLARSAAAVLSALTALAVLGCRAPARPPCDELRGRLGSQSLVIAVWRHDQVTTTGLAPGIDLDFMDSDGTGPECTDDVDFVSPLRGAPGVDNQYAAYLLGALDGPSGTGGLNAAVAAELARGLSLQGLEIRVVASDAAPHDEAVARGSDCILIASRLSPFRLSPLRPSPALRDRTRPAGARRCRSPPSPCAVQA